MPLYHCHTGTTIGGILIWGSSTPPEGFLLCDGSTISRTDYVELFEILGTTFGIGDNLTTFNLPDLRQRFPLGKATTGTGDTLGTTGGNIDHIHTIDPPNTTTSEPSATISSSGLLGSVASSTHTHDVDISQFNSGSNNPPFQVVNFIIKVCN